MKVDINERRIFFSFDEESTQKFKPVGRVTRWKDGWLFRVGEEMCEGPGALP